MRGAVMSLMVPNSHVRDLQQLTITYFEHI